MLRDGAGEPVPQDPWRSIRPSELLAAESDRAYEIVTLAPTSSNFFLIASASSLVHAFLDRLGRALDEVLGFLQTQAGDLADDLDDLDLVAADFGQRDVELGLLLDRRCRAAAAAAATRHRHGIAAAADTPSSDSSAFTSCDSSSTLMPLM